MTSPGIKKSVLPLLAIAAVLAALTGCASDTGSEAANTPTSIETATTEPATETPTAEPEPEPGTRGNPLPIGQSMRLSEESMWTVGATGETYQHGAFLVVPVQIGIDWESWREQNPNKDPNDRGSMPGHSLTIEYIAADGRSYRIETWSSTDGLPELVQEIGTVYPPLDTVDTHFGVNIDDLPNGIDGVWRVSNNEGDSVFLATA